MITITIENYVYRTDKLDKIKGRYLFDTIMKDGTVQHHDLIEKMVLETVETEDVTVDDYWKERKKGLEQPEE